MSCSELLATASMRLRIRSLIQSDFGGSPRGTDRLSCFPSPGTHTNAGAGQHENQAPAPALPFGVVLV